LSKLFFIYVTTFLSLHLSGALSSILDLSLNFDKDTARIFKVEQIFSSYAALEIGQYLILAILSSGLFLYGHYQIVKYALRFYTVKSSPLFIHLSWAIIATVCLLIINTSLFSQSVFFMPDYLTLSNDNPVIILITIIAILPALLLLPFLYLQHRKTLYVFLLMFTSAPLLTPPISKQQSRHIDKPNIIFIGIDSLRPELINQYMPFLNGQLKKSITFENAYTPFARTYPSWMSIITGRHPVNHQARFNLQPESMLAPDNMYLPARLNKIGYQSIYASDERRFSNLGESQGFNQVIGPRTGAADFILGNYADLPITNLLSRLSIAEWLLPELYSNRAADHLYQPSQFSSLLHRKLTNLEDTPVFLSVHFCLAHWPYTFVGHSINENYTEKPAYPDNLRAIDKQISELFELLKVRGLLENSRVVFLSDHGESWGIVDTQLKNSDGEALKVLDHGHGMNILSPSSHKVLLALKGFNIAPGKSQRLTSLLDISPTIADSLGLPFETELYDGHSLLQVPPEHIEISFESGVVIAAANQKDPDPQTVAKAGLHRFELYEDGSLRLKEAAIKEMLSQKQLGLRQNQQGLVRGKFLSQETKYLLLDYQANKYQALNGLNKTHASHPKLVKSFCNLFAASNIEIHNDCVNL